MYKDTDGTSDIEQLPEVRMGRRQYSSNSIFLISINVWQINKFPDLLQGLFVAESNPAKAMLVH